MIQDIIIGFQKQGGDILYPFFPMIVTVISLLSLGIIWINRKIFLNLFQGVSKKTLSVLILIIIVFILLCYFEGFSFKTFNHSDFEWTELNAAKELLSGNQYIFHQMRHRVTLTLFLSLVFKIFGINPMAASLLNLFLGVFSIFLVFLLTQIIFKNQRVSLFSAFIYAFTPHTLIFTALRMGDPTAVGFFLFLFAITAILAFKHHRLSLHILTLAFFALANQTKPEYFILIFPYIFCFILFKEYRHLLVKKIAILIAIFFLFSAPFFVSNAYFRRPLSSNWCGHPSQTFNNGRVYSYMLPLTAPLDKILKFLTNSRFSTNYLIYDIPTFIRFWFSRQLIWVSLLVILGIFFALKERKKESLFALFVFLSISIVYLADCAFYEDRYAIASYGIMVIFSGLGIDLLAKKICKIVNNRKSNKIIFSSFIIPTALLSLLLSFWYFNPSNPNTVLSYRDYNTTNLTDSYNDLKDIMDKYGSLMADSYLMPVHTTERDILKFLGYETEALSESIRANYFENRQNFFKSFQLPFDQNKDIYFIYSYHCQCLKEMADVCDFVLQNYTKEKIGVWTGGGIL